MSLICHVQRSAEIKLPVSMMADEPVATGIETSNAAFAGESAEAVSVADEPTGEDSTAPGQGGLLAETTPSLIQASQASGRFVVNCNACSRKGRLDLGKGMEHPATPVARPSSSKMVGGGMMLAQVK